MATLSQWLRDWRSIADRLTEPGREAITMTHDDRTYEVLAVATYVPGIEEGHIMARTPSRDFDGKVALYSRRTRDTGLMRLITNKGAPRFVLRPGAEAMEWASAVEGIPAAKLVSASRMGGVSHGIARRARQEKWNSDQIMKAMKDIEAQFVELEEELEGLRSEGLALKRELNRSSPAK